MNQQYQLHDNTVEQILELASIGLSIKMANGCDTDEVKDNEAAIGTVAAQYPKN